MNINRLWILAAVLVSGAVVALGWVLGVAPKLAEAEATDAQRVSVEAQNQLHEIELARIKVQYEQLDELRDRLSDLQDAIPPGDELSEFIGQLHELESRHGVDVTHVSASDAEPFLPAAGDAATESVAAVTSDTFFAIPLTVTASGPHASLMSFVEGLQMGKRLFLVSTLNVTEQDAGATAVVTGLAYVLTPAPAAPPVADTPSEPAAP